MADEHLMSLQPGTVIAGRYEVVKCLGAGSMGLVYACRHRELSGHMVAVKVLFPEVAQDRIAAARFRNEIFASYGVSHPNVVRAFEFIRDGDLVAYTMEFVGGGDLADRLGRPNNPIQIPEVVRLLTQMCLGVQAIHDAGIVHRDLKPENILLTREGQVKIADFGIAKASHGPKLTEHGGVVGTIDYVSPEYMLKSQVDWRSDIYALGILAYEMIAGEPPFRGDSVYATMTQRLKKDPAPPSSIRKECPPELDAIVLRAMHRNPEERYQSASEIFGDLQRLLPPSQRVTTPSNFQAAPPPVPPQASVAQEEDRPRTPAAPARESQPPPLLTPAITPQIAQTIEISAADYRPGNVSAGFSGGTAGFGSEGAQAADPAPRPSAVAPDQESTEEHELSSRSERISSPTVHEPMQPAKMLSDGWERVEPRSRTPHFGSGSLDAGKLHSARHEAEAPAARGLSWMVDALTIVIAILIGVSIGFVVLKYSAPELLAKFEEAGRRLYSAPVEDKVS